jgi:hypothetical protein
MTIADSWGMRANASTAQRVSQNTDDNRAPEAREMDWQNDSQRGDGMNRRDTTANRVEALLRAHPSIVHEID